jgi:HPt (histidine-containing phosphotransfer) domain-containing protein
MMKGEGTDVQGSDNFSPTVFNLESTMETVMDSEALFQQIAEMLIENCPNHIAKIKSAINENDSDALEREAHSLKGAVGNFGADNAYEAAFHLEKLGKNGDMASAAEGLSNLEKELGELITELKLVLRRMAR